MAIRSSSKGFTLLEAVVALVIISTSGIALFTWLNVSLTGLTRVSDVIELKLLMDDLDAYFYTLNIPDETEQQLYVNGYDVNWKSTLVEPKQMGRNRSGGLSMYDLGLYDIEVGVYKNERFVGQYFTRIVGYQKTREPPKGVSP